MELLRWRGWPLVDKLIVTMILLAALPLLIVAL